MINNTTSLILQKELTYANICKNNAYSCLKAHNLVTKQVVCPQICQFCVQTRSEPERHVSVTRYTQMCVFRAICAMYHSIYTLLFCMWLHTCYMHQTRVRIHCLFSAVYMVWVCMSYIIDAGGWSLPLGPCQLCRGQGCDQSGEQLLHTFDIISELHYYVLHICIAHNGLSSRRFAVNCDLL